MTRRPEPAATVSRRKKRFRSYWSRVGLVRVEVMVPAEDAGQIRELAAELRGAHERRLLLGGDDGDDDEPTAAR